MLKNCIKRSIFIVTAFVMFPALIPHKTLADNLSADTAVTIDTAASCQSFSNSANAQAIQSEINALMEHYHISNSMAEEEIEVAVADMDSEYREALYEAMLLEEQLADAVNSDKLTEDEVSILAESNPALGIFAQALQDRYAEDKSVSILATTVTVLNGQISITDTATNMSESGGTVTAKAKGGLLSQTTNTITITNTSGSTATISFSYSASNYGSFTDPDGGSTASGTKSAVVQNGGTLTLSIKGKKALSSNTATLTLKDFSLAATAASSSVTFEYDNSLGSITVGGTPTANDAAVDITSSGAALVATPISGARFLGWINTADNSILSQNASYTLIPAADMTVKAVFIGTGSAPWFMLGNTTQHSKGLGTDIYVGTLGGTRYYYSVPAGTHMYDDLNAATSAAVSLGKNAIVLMNDGTLPDVPNAANGIDYTIPSGVTLLIPFDSNNTLYTTQPDNVDSPETGDSYVSPTAYRTLTLAANVKIAVNGAISLSAKHRAANGAVANGGSPTDKVSFLKMPQSSSITVNSGGALYAYGFITGTTKGTFTADNCGTITVEPGGTVYENFQIMDFRGGDQSTTMENGVFPLSQYYVQNIEVPLTIKAGATEYCYTTANMQGGYWELSVAFIGANGSMFSLGTDAWAVKRYDGATDRLILELSGTASLSNIKLDLGLSSIDSNNFDLPLNSNITIIMHSGSNASVTQDILMLPGSELIIEETAVCTLGSGKNAYIYDVDQWGTYAGATNKKFIPLTYAPGRTYTRTEADLVDAIVQVDGTLDASGGYLYTTAGGANICSTKSGVVVVDPDTDITDSNTKPQTITHQLVQGTGYTEIPITPAKLKNSDGSFTLTENCSTLNTYNYVDGFWRCETHTWGDWSTGACSVCGEKAISCNGILLDVRSEIQLQLKFAVHQDLLDEYANLRAYVTEQENTIDKDGDAWDVLVTDLPTDDDRYVVKQGIAAGEMTGLVTVQFKSGDTVIPVYDKYKNAMVNSVEKTVVSFAKAALEAEGDSGRNVALSKAALTFGGYAQSFYGTHTDKLAYSFFGSEAPNVTVSSWDGYSTKISSTEGLALTPTTQKLNLDSMIYMRMYFEGSTDGYTATLHKPSQSDEDGVDVKLDFKTVENGRICLDIEDIPPAYWNDTYQITISNGSKSYTIETSVLAWCARCVAQSSNPAQVTMAQAMYHYAVAADIYFSAKNGQ